MKARAHRTALGLPRIHGPLHALCLFSPIAYNWSTSLESSQMTSRLGRPLGTRIKRKRVQAAGQSGLLPGCSFCPIEQATQDGTSLEMHTPNITNLSRAQRHARIHADTGTHVHTRVQATCSHTYTLPRTHKHVHTWQCTCAHSHMYARAHTRACPGPTHTQRKTALAPIHFQWSLLLYWL